MATDLYIASKRNITNNTKQVTKQIKNIKYQLDKNISLFIYEIINIVHVWKGYSLAAITYVRMFKFSANLSLKYPSPMQWLFKLFVFKCMYEIWHNTTLFQTRLIVKP